MQNGWIKVAAGTPEMRVADVRWNAEKICEQMDAAQRAGVHLLVLPELCLTGATCGDLFLQHTLLEGALDGLSDVVAHSAGMPLVTVVGLPVALDGAIYDAAAVVQDGEVLGVVPRAQGGDPVFAAPFEGVVGLPLLETEVAFGTGLQFACYEVPECRFAVSIGEDLSQPFVPSAQLAVDGAVIVAAPLAEAGIIGSDSFRAQQVADQSARLTAAYIVANAGPGESTSDMVYSGQRLIAENGQLLSEDARFTHGLAVTEIDVARLTAERRRKAAFRAPQARAIAFSLPYAPTALTRSIDPSPFIPHEPQALAARCEEILTIQATGLARRLAHIHAGSAVLGISGGLDSTLALLVMVRAMDLLNRPHTDVVAVTMPCYGTTQRTRGNAEMLCDALGVTLRTVDIAAAVAQHFSDIGHSMDNHNVVFENAQARERTQVLMDIANQVNGIVVGTGDLSELALGWATYNGDHMSMYGVNGTVPKTLIRHIVRHVAQSAGEGELRRILLDILDTPVSPELLPAKDGEIAQKTEDLVGPYDLHDFFLYHLVRWHCPPAKIYALACHAFEGRFDEETILKWLKTFCRRFFQQQFKRNCLPDGVKVGSVSLSPRGDWRMPSDAAAALWLAELEAL